MVVESLVLPNNATIPGGAVFEDSRTWPAYPILPLRRKKCTGTNRFDKGNIGVCMPVNARLSAPAHPTVFLIDMFEAENHSLESLMRDAGIDKVYYNNLQELSQDWIID